MEDRIKGQIVGDTIKITTEEISTDQHLSAENFIKALNLNMGQQPETERNKPDFEQVQHTEPNRQFII